MKRAIIPQSEFGFADASFALVTEHAMDGARVQAEADQARQDRAENEQKQTTWTEPSEQTHAEFETAALHQQRAMKAAEGKAPCWFCKNLIDPAAYQRQTLQHGYYCDAACEAGRVEYLDGCARRAQQRLEEITHPGLAAGSAWHQWKGGAK